MLVSCKHKEKLPKKCKILSTKILEFYMKLYFTSWTENESSGPQVLDINMYICLMQ